MSENMHDFVEAVENAVSTQETAKVLEIFAPLHPSDIAYIASQVDTDEHVALIDIICSLDNLDEVIHELDKSTLEKVVDQLDEKSLSVIFAKLDTDDIAYFLSFLQEELREKILRNMVEEDVDEVDKLLKYEEETAGRIMTTEVFSLHEDATILDAFQALKASPDVEMIYYLYVVDHRQHLIGVVSLRELLTKDNNLKLNAVMNENVISVRVTLDQEEVARQVERYNFAAIPVVDKKNKLVGLITVDDIIDVIRHEATEDIMKLAGTNEEEFSLRSPMESFKRRMPWLLVSFFGGLLTIQSMAFFTVKLHHAILLAFVPIIAGMGGNIGSQSATIIVRGLATGKIMVTKLWDVVFQEIATGLFLGLFFGISLGIMAQVQFNEVALIGFIVALGLLFSMIIAAAIGSLMPMIFQKLNVDPAVATGPFVSTTIDNIGLLGYLGSALYLSQYITT